MTDPRLVTYVVDDAVTFIARGARENVGISAYATPMDAFNGDLALMLARFATAMREHDRTSRGGTVLIGPLIAEQLGLPATPPVEDDAAKAHPALTPARAVGWETTKLGPWTSFRRNGSPTVHLGVLPWLDSEIFELISSDAGTMAWRMQWMATWLRAPYRARPGVTAMAAMQQMVAGKTPYWKPNWDHVTPVGAFESTIGWERPYIWDSPSSDVLELGHTHLHGWDIQGQFIAAASAAYLCRDALRHTKKTAYDGSGGYWQIAVPPWAYDKVLPHPAGQNVSHGDVIWVTSPRLELLTKLAEEHSVIAAPVIVDSWTADKPARLLRPWAELCRDMMYAMESIPDEIDRDIMRTAGKHAYSHAISMLRSPEGLVQRVDWNDTIHGVAGSAMWLKLWRQFKADGRTPAKIYHDMAYYPGMSSDYQSDRPSTFEPSPLPGRFTWKKSVEL